MHEAILLDVAGVRTAMKVHGHYDQNGYAHLEGLLLPQLAQTLLDHLWRDLRDDKLPLSFRQNALLTRPAAELHSSNSPAITAFLWGLTPMIGHVTGCELLPSYAYFRLYQKNDRLRVHADRAACEHSVSLTLGYSDGLPWSFEIGHDQAAGDGSYAEDFGSESFSTIAMKPGDAMLYRGIDRRHGRLSLNPNKWSAHLFLHWVDRNGRYSAHAFERWPEESDGLEDGLRDQFARV